jgi:hypothetical protein
VCKFAAVAQKVTIEVAKEPAPEVAAKQPAAKKTGRRQSTFSMLAMSKKSKDSLLTGRGSIRWEQPQGPILQSSISAGNLSDIFSSSIFQKNFHLKNRRHQFI